MSTASAPVPFNEDERLFRLKRYHVLDTQPEQEFDLITRLAASHFEVPVSLVSFVDKNRQWFKSHHGLASTQTPRDHAFCAHAILHDEVFVIPDATRDDRFCDNPLVTEAPHIRFYAGAPLKCESGHNIGTLCVIDSRPHPPLSAKQCELLAGLAHLVMDELDLRLNARRLHDEVERLEFLSRENDELRRQLDTARYETCRAQTHAPQSSLITSVPHSGIN